MSKNYSTFAIAEMLHVDPGSIANWIDQNLLKAYRTPGGHRRVQEEDLLAFLRHHKMPIPPELGTRLTRVLVVDDDPAVTKVISRAIRQGCPEFEVVEANDGFQAGAMLATLKPDVVILDLRMPGMDGYEVCRMIKSDGLTQHAEIIAITAYPSADSEREILKCGARVCLAKPLDIDELLKQVRASV